MDAVADQGGVRRVVIDSQAARRGPGGPGGGPGPSNQPTRRPGGRGRRRRRGDFYEIEDARREAREAAEAARGSVLAALTGLGWPEKAAAAALDDVLASEPGTEAVPALLRLCLARLGPAPHTPAPHTAPPVRTAR